MVCAWPCTMLPSSICWCMWAGPPVSTACSSLLSWSKWPTALAPSRCMVPWSMRTLPVSVSSLLSWLIIEWSALTCTGWLLSDCLPCAAVKTMQAASAKAKARARISMLPRLRRKRGVDIGEQLQRVGIHVGLHADAAQYRAGLLNHAGRGGGHALVFRPDRGIGRMHFGGLHRADRRPTHVHLADQLDQRIVGADPGILRRAVPVGMVGAVDRIDRRVDVQRIVALAAREIRRDQAKCRRAVFTQRVQREVAERVAGARRSDHLVGLRRRLQPPDQQLRARGSDQQRQSEQKALAIHQEALW